ncbi:hypothetical protein [Kribbella qitaiheensis]|uniref:hypothetical protein n=1 Tax=Kribbella qitaiheensis TaxID=1544730 RepID=UPI0016263909|nr:hypothetical protein [Kribbella qitaiheensis]
MTESSNENNGHRAIHEHEFVTNPCDGLLYCQRCPMVAYDLADAATEPICPMPLRP